MAINLNKHIVDSEEVAMLRDIGLFEAITDKHRNSGLAPIYQWGQVLIDRIFISGSLSISLGGYFPVAYAPLDYRALYIKVKISLAFGYML